MSKPSDVSYITPDNVSCRPRSDKADHLKLFGPMNLLVLSYLDEDMRTMLLVFTDARAADEVARDRTMIYISYHDNNHFNSVRPPRSSQPNGPGFLTRTERLEADMECAINNHQMRLGKPSPWIP